MVSLFRVFAAPQVEVSVTVDVAWDDAAHGGGEAVHLLAEAGEALLHSRTLTVTPASLGRPLVCLLALPRRSGLVIRAAADRWAGADAELSLPPPDDGGGGAAVACDGRGEEEEEGARRGGKRRRGGGAEPMEGPGPPG